MMYKTEHMLIYQKTQVEEKFHRIQELVVVLFGFQIVISDWFSKHVYTAMADIDKFEFRFHISSFGVDIGCCVEIENSECHWIVGAY